MKAKIKVNNKIELVDTDKIKPYEKNPKTHSKGQIQRLKKLIQQVGFDDPLIVDKNLNLIAGHGRLQAAIELEIKQVPIIKKDDLTINDIKAYRIGHNEVSISPWDEEYKAEEFKELLENMDKENIEAITSVSEEDMKSLINKIEGKDKKVFDDVSKASGASKMKHKCPECGHEWVSED